MADNTVRHQTQPAPRLVVVGPLLLAGVFGFVLYALHVPIDLLVVVAIGLLVWPLYEFVGIIVDQALIALFLNQSSRRWMMFRNGFFPLFGVVVFVGLYFFSQWLWLVVFAQCLHLAVQPPTDATFRESRAAAKVNGGLLFGILLLVVSGAPAGLSALFRFPNVSGPLAYLPGMLILAIIYYVSSAILLVLIPILRRPIHPE